MKIRKPDPGLACLLVRDLVERDSRLAMIDDHVEMLADDEDALQIDQADFVMVTGEDYEVGALGYWAVGGGTITVNTTADEYGAREALLRHSDLLFDEAALRALAGRFEADLEKALHARGQAERRGVREGQCLVTLDPQRTQRFV